MTAEKERLIGEAPDIQAKLAETQKALRKVTLMIGQSQSELSKLTQRNAAITAHLQQVQSKIEQTSPQEIRMSYDSALDAQQRLFVMHGQLDKLQSNKRHLEEVQAASGTLWKPRYYTGGWFSSSRRKRRVG